MRLAEKSDREILAVAGPIMDNLMEGSTTIDHDKHTRDFTDRMKRIVTKEYLETVCRTYQAERGYFAKRECVAELVLMENESRYLVDHAMVF